jgi:hypothetical protein
LRGRQRHVFFFFFFFVFFSFFFFFFFFFFFLASPVFWLEWSARWTDWSGPQPIASLVGWAPLTAAAAAATRDVWVWVEWRLKALEVVRPASCMKGVQLR